MPEIDGICFDLFSTLVHKKPGNPFFGKVADELGLDLARWKPAYDELHDDTMASIVPGIVARVVLSAKAADVRVAPDAAEAAVHRHFGDFVASMEVDAQAVPLLERLRTGGTSLALVTNASDHAEWLFDRLGLRECFDVTVFSHRVGRLKPHPGIYRSATDRLGIAASRCAFVGDGQHDELRGAREVGMTTVLVDRRLPHTAAARAHADFVVRDLDEVGTVLDGLTVSPDLNSRI
ncbi:HAD family hydrolase [Amycolatopsis sp. NPDC098790]|uniref:HAD family hydrolase n=1 Tax=Amycolatopsis sp. NPDC098790 TaxID=3363939 RepID=UPI003800C670